MGGSRGGGVSGVATPPNGQSHSMKCSASGVLSHADALVYIANSLVVVVVSCIYRLLNCSPEALRCSLRFRVLYS